MKYSFANDYCEGAHPRILEALAASNMDQEPGYGLDSMSRRARECILKECGDRGSKGPDGVKDAEVHLISGGTQANLVMTHAMLHSYQSIIAVDSGHINVHETGAIEATGHKVHSVPGVHGKLTVEAALPILESHHGEHMVQPKAVFISNSTELGTVYTRAELAALAELCREWDLFLYMDGARLGSGLMSEATDLTMADVAEHCDAFYIGGTKNGALLGEAMVLRHERLMVNFRHYMKQRGGLLAKGRLIGTQFMVLFEDGLFYELAAHANAMAMRLARGIEAAGHGFLQAPATNQLFPIFPDELAERLTRDFAYTPWQTAGRGRQAIRLVTSWATREDMVDAFIDAL